MRLIHDGTKVIALVGDEVSVATGNAVFIGAAEQCEAEIARLGFLHPNRSAAADYFRQQPPAIQSAFGPAFQALSALPRLADVVTGVSAITVPASMAEVKTRILEILRG